ncbi:neuroligin [Rhyzopertha dominica]|nr:neuroligin [Rhyzopertha dominica]
MLTALFFSAGTREGSSSPKYPVIVFIHGESYEWNSGNPYDGTVLASYGGVVVVTVNYRLGILGFLNANTDPNLRSPANYGLMDQIAALHWLQENIAVFGGDPTNVTVVGHGTGAACVNFLLTSSAVPEGVLFHRAILMSGSALSPWALIQEPSRYAAQVAIHANCSPELPHPHLLKCLRERPLDVLMSTPVIAPDFAFAFGPSVDGVVIDTGEPPASETSHYSEYETNKPPKAEIQNAINTLNNVLLRKPAISKLTRYDLLLGVVKSESYFTFNTEDIQYGIEPDRRSKILRTFVRNTYSYHLSEILATIVNEYTDWEKPVQHPINIRDETLEALSDAQYVAPVVHTADLHSAEHRNSYLYVFDYQTKFGDYPQRPGCIHGEELPYVFGAPLVGGFSHFGRNYTKSETLLAETTMIYWSNFARTGNPNEAPEADLGHPARTERSRFKNIEWTAYEAVHKKYLNLDMKPKLKNHYRAHRLSFWLNLVPDLHRPGGDDVPASHHQLPDDDPPPPKLPQLNPRKLTTTENPLDPARTTAASNLSAPATADSTERMEELAPSTTSHPVEDGFAAYSTALSVTIAIGCSLLILNVLIFAGVYYQRDKTRMSENGGQPKKRNENGQMPNNICGDLESSIIGVKSDPATILGHHHSHHQLPPPEFADLPQNNATLPRPPPPPKISKSNVNTLSSSNQIPENQPLLTTHSIQLINTGTLTKKNTQLNSKHNVTMEELRV